MTLNPALSARLSRSGVVALPATRNLPDGGIELRFLLAEQDGDNADQPSRVPGAELDRSIVGSGDGWVERWRDECARADAVCAAHFGIDARHVSLQNGLVVAHFSRDQRTDSVRWVEGLGWAGW